MYVLMSFLLRIILGFCLLLYLHMICGQILLVLPSKCTHFPLLPPWSQPHSPSSGFWSLFFQTSSNIPVDCCLLHSDLQSKSQALCDASLNLLVGPSLLRVRARVFALASWPCMIRLMPPWPHPRLALPLPVTLASFLSFLALLSLKHSLSRLTYPHG